MFSVGGKAPSLRGAFFMRRMLTVRRVSGVVHALALLDCAWAASVSGVIRVRLSLSSRGNCHHVHTRSYIGARVPSEFLLAFHSFSLNGTLPVLVFAPLRLCISAPLRVSSSQRRSFVSPLLSSLHGSCLLSSRPRLRPSLVATDFNI